MAVSREPASPIMTLSHGAPRLSSVEVMSYNVELKDEKGYVGDRASKGAFRHFIDQWRKPLRRIGQDPFGNERSNKIAKKKLDDLLAKGDAESAGIVQGAIELFAQELAVVLRRFLKLKSWKNAERIVFGGGFAGSSRWRARDRPRLGAVKERKHQNRDLNYPPRSGRGRADWRRAPGADLDVQGPRRDSRR